MNILENIFKIFSYFFLLCYRLKNFKAPFHKKKFGKFLKFPKIKFHQLYDIIIINGSVAN